MPGLRSFVLLRYLGWKQRILEQRRNDMSYIATTEELHHEVAQHTTRPGPGNWFLWLLRPVVCYPLLLLVLGSLLWGGYQYREMLQTRALFRDTLPAYSNAVYRLKAALERGSNENILDAIRDELAMHEQAALDFFVEQPHIREPLNDLLVAVASNDTEAIDMLPIAKAFNDRLFAAGYPYYVSVVTESSPCSFLPSERFLERLFGGGAAADDAEMCETHALLSFLVEDARYFNDQSQDHLALFTRRLDRQTVDEGVLGRVHIGDNTAQVMLSNIAGVSDYSVRAINQGALQKRLVPDGMTDVYGLESIARRIQSRVIDQYTQAISNRLDQRVKSVLLELVGRKTDPLELAARQLESRIADVTAYHEVQHLVDQALPLVEPEWFSQSVRLFGERIQGGNFKQHVLWELSAFFTHLAYAEELQGVLLNEFTAITLDPMLQDQPHYYAVRLLLPVLYGLAKKGIAEPPVPAMTLADVARMYKALAAQHQQLGRLAREAYPVLFGMPVPVLTQTPARTNRMPGWLYWQRPLPRSAVGQPADMAVNFGASFGSKQLHVHPH